MLLIFQLFSDLIRYVSSKDWCLDMVSLFKSLVALTMWRTQQFWCFSCPIKCLIGDIQKICGHDFIHFWLPTSLPLWTLFFTLNDNRNSKFWTNYNHPPSKVLIRFLNDPLETIHVKRRQFLHHLRPLPPQVCLIRCPQNTMEGKPPSPWTCPRLIWMTPYTTSSTIGDKRRLWDEILVNFMPYALVLIFFQKSNV